MRKKRYLIISGVVLFIALMILLFPITSHADDGGTKQHKAVLYSIYNYHSIRKNDERYNWYRSDIAVDTVMYSVGVEIIIFGKTVYRNTSIVTRDECGCKKCKFD